MVIAQNLVSRKISFSIFCSPNFSILFFPGIVTYFDGCTLVLVNTKFSATSLPLLDLLFVNRFLNVTALAVI